MRMLERNGKTRTDVHQEMGKEREKWLIEQMGHFVLYCMISDGIRYEECEQNSYSLWFPVECWDQVGNY